MVRRALKLPLRFDPVKLRADLHRAESRTWIGHFNQGYHDGGWTGLPLRSPGGSEVNLFAALPQAAFSDTALLAECPYVRSILDGFECPVFSVRFLRLAAGSVIREHRDFGLDFEDGEVRIHIPVVTNPSVEFYIDGVRVVMAEGETWYTNVNLPHRVQNLGDTDRIHLVIDCGVNDWLERLFAEGEPVPDPESIPRDLAGPAGRLREFIELVWSDPDLQQQFWEVEDMALFVRLVHQVAAERGFRFTEEDLRSEMRISRGAWLERLMA